MKKTILAVACFLASATVHASMVEQYESTLYSFEMQKGSVLEKVNEGNVLITPITNNIQLSLSKVHHIMCITAPCPQPKGPFPTYNFDVKITEIKTGACNEKIYVGKQDLRPVDGGLTEITVIDNTTNVCPSKVPVPGTQVILKLESLRGGSEFHKMSGEVMSLVM